uniref:PIN domain-containing protein n=1 Tax=Phaeomonas parva TaxID=124430 RepID=A0A7S1XPP0_9STRA|eukprot:CAMPEP_0118877700 /NCGR_PEP_ID=MMETSP1163-20130328/17903_1 /TAXON_ID=124430 /ORGANISM="Phaeomonas parva, Strain CCMP2877" /LENGTH=195 /DNA_ID=CAMNT_0006813447 /DNA_START=52 /DNA_END=639 /DNA_ORIENTATION=-
MGKAKKTRKFAVAKRTMAASDMRLKRNQEKQAKKEAEKQGKKVTKVRQAPTGMFFTYNNALGPPFHVLVDTNFINFAIRNKLDLYASMMDCLLAKSIPCVTDCVMAELEKLGSRYRVALRMAKDPRFMRIPCMCRGTYADDCLVQMVQQHRCYIVATCDRELKQRIRKIPGVPIMYISARRFTIERMPEAFGAPR